MEVRSSLIGLGLGLGLGYLIWKTDQAPCKATSSSAKCPPCSPGDAAKGCEAGGKDAARTIADFKNRNSTWVPGLLPQILSKMNLLSVDVRTDSYEPSASTEWKANYRECFGTTLASFGLSVDENGKVSA